MSESAKPSLEEFTEKERHQELDLAQLRVKELEAIIKGYRRDELNAEFVKRKIIELKTDAAKTVAPDWVLSSVNRSPGDPGIPTLFISDVYWGEVVLPEEVAGANAYNMEIARERFARLINGTEHLLLRHLAVPQYPGIVVVLGGDLVSGDIHEELTNTNEQPIMTVVLDIYGALIGVIKRFADTFGRVFVPCVAGNHGRTTRKMPSKRMVHTNYDWLICQLLAKRFEDDPRVTFLIPDGSDAYFSLYATRYLLTHGNQFRGGDGLIGPIGPITRGDHKKRSRNSQLGMPTDVMLLGHFHSLLMMRRVIVNGSVKGMDSYAYQSNFIYEPPMQALWLTHPTRGITFTFPVHLDDDALKSVEPCVEVFKVD